MDGYEDKKWFVYMGDHHEGPFSLAEIQAKMTERQVTASNHVWSEGMADWKLMSEVPQFEAIVKTQSPAAPPPLEPVQAPAAEKSSAESVFTQETSPSLAMNPFAVQNANSQPVNPFLVATPEPNPEQSTSQQSTPEQSTSEQAVTLTELSQPAMPMQPLEPTAPLMVQLEARPTPAAHHIDMPAPVMLERPPGGEADLQEFAKVRQIERKAAAKGFFGRLFSVVLKLAVLGLLIGVVGFAFKKGYFTEVLKSPAVNAALQTVTDTAQPYLLQVVEKFPALGQWISPIRSLDDVSTEDYAELRAAAGTKAQPGAAKLALALSRADLLAPKFYVSSNLPDGARVEVYVEGVPDTLLNQLSYLEKRELTVVKKLGATSEFRFSGKPLPRGQYLVFAVESESQSSEVNAILVGSQAPEPDKITLGISPSIPKGRKLLVWKSYFLGGEKDGDYTARLKAFHDKLREKAGAELSEVKQFAVTLESQLKQSIQRYDQLRKGRLTPQKKKAWQAYNKSWTDFAKQMNTTFIAWTEKSLKDDFFYGVLYRLTQQAGQAVERAHSFHNTYFTAVVSRSFDIQAGEAISQAQGAITALKAKIDQAERITPTLNGMPRREGL
ncbi:MAG TPA: GYF domain-containing protein [Bdellovibrionota bacterium]|nr:GYF domain-containing protein [Bdellovibrionota bacterium]